MEEKKRDAGAVVCSRREKSSEAVEKKGDRTKYVGRLEGLKVGMLRSKEVERPERVEAGGTGWSVRFKSQGSTESIGCQE